MDTFDPVKYSIGENRFLLENAGSSPVVALKGAENNPDMNVRAVRPVLQEIYDRVQLQESKDISWIGLAAVKKTILKFVELNEKWEKDFTASRGRIPRFPTMHLKDAKGRYHRSGPGSDNDHPRTWIDGDGKRHRFEIDLSGYGLGFDDEDYNITAVAPTELIHDAEKNRIECPICSHTESFRETQSSERAARARMMKHLKSPKVKKVSLHMELYTTVSGT